MVFQVSVKELVPLVVIRKVQSCPAVPPLALNVQAPVGVMVTIEVVILTVIVPVVPEVAALPASPPLAKGSVPDTVEVPTARVKPEPVAPLVSVPVPVMDEPVTVAFKVAPERVPAGATTAAVEIPVVRPLASIVTTGMAVEEPVVPADATEARVVVIAVAPEPVRSPESVTVWFPVRKAVEL